MSAKKIQAKIFICLLTVILNCAQIAQPRAEPGPQNHKQTAYNLATIYKMAMAFDKELQASKDDLEAAGYNVKQITGELLPQIDLSLSADINNEDQPHKESYTNKNYQLSITQKLFDANTFYARDVAETELHNKKLHYADSVQNLIGRLTATYFSILKQKAVLTSLAKEENALYSQLKAAESNFTTGTLSRVDLADIEAQYRLVTTV